MRRSFPPVAIFVGSFAVTSFAVASLPVAHAVGQQPPQPRQPQQTEQPSQTPPGGTGAPGAAPAPPASGDAAPTTSSTPAKPLIPVAASTLAAHPETYYGENVSVTGNVEQVLSKFTFSVDQGKTRSDGRQVLVVAPTLQLPVDPNTYVTVLGQVVKFDLAEVAAKTNDFKNDLAPDVVAKYKGGPAIIATSVINSAGLDIAKRLPPPMTSEEQEFQKVMRQVGPANAALRGAIDKTDPAATKEQTTVLTKAFTQAMDFWKGRGKADAVKWATEARALAESIDKAIAAGKWDDAKTSLGTLGQQCQSCHGTYRERFDDGSFRIKPGSR